MNHSTPKPVHTAGSKGATPRSSQTLLQCLQRRVVAWHEESPEYKLRIVGVLDMLINTGYILEFGSIIRLALTSLLPLIK
jgi:hypothetical protein